MEAHTNWSKRFLEVLTETLNYRRVNPSRWTRDGYLKPICPDGQHKQFGGSAKCEVCGVVVDE